MLSKQLDDLRKEHQSVLVALQSKMCDITKNTDHVHRLEVQVKSLTSEIAGYKQELQTKQDLIFILQDKHRILEQQALEKKQAQSEAEQLRAKLLVQEQERAQMQTQLDELCARLYSHYQQVLFFSAS